MPTDADMNVSVDIRLCLLVQCELAIYCQCYHNSVKLLSEKATESAD